MGQRIGFCTASDGVRLAYAVTGSGPPLVKAANWLSHLEFDWESPLWRHWRLALSSTSTLIRYDARGCGLSDWDAADLSLDAWVDDLASVVREVGVEKFDLHGYRGFDPTRGRDRRQGVDEAPAPAPQSRSIQAPAIRGNGGGYDR